MKNKIMLITGGFLLSVAGISAGIAIPMMAKQENNIENKNSNINNDTENSGNYKYSEYKLTNPEQELTRNNVTFSYDASFEFSDGFSWPADSDVNWQSSLGLNRTFYGDPTNTTYEIDYTLQANRWDYTKTHDHPEIFVEYFQNVKNSSTGKVEFEEVLILSDYTTDSHYQYINDGEIEVWAFVTDYTCVLIEEEKFDFQIESKEFLKKTKSIISDKDSFYKK